MPTLPRLENAATCELESVSGCQNALLLLLASVTMFVMLRNCSSAPTVITSLAVAGEKIVSGLPPVPSSLPPPPPPLSRFNCPPLPAENTNSIGCEPTTPACASRVAAS